jgi:hypothetical protein
MTIEEAAELRQIHKAIEGDQVAFEAIIKRMIRFKIGMPTPVANRGGYLVVPEMATVEEFEQDLADLREFQARLIGAGS